jgi:hypothetical protein
LLKRPEARIRGVGERSLRLRVGSAVRELFETLAAANADGRAGFAARPETVVGL